jgi:hypothetical protein
MDQNCCRRLGSNPQLHCSNPGTLNYWATLLMTHHDMMQCRLTHEVWEKIRQLFGEACEAAHHDMVRRMKQLTTMWWGVWSSSPRHGEACEAAQHDMVRRIKELTKLWWGVWSSSTRYGEAYEAAQHDMVRRMKQLTTIWWCVWSSSPRYGEAYEATHHDMVRRMKQRIWPYESQGGHATRPLALHLRQSWRPWPCVTDWQ